VFFAIINITAIKQMFNTTTWEKKIELLKEYKKAHGHLRFTGKLNQTLSVWATKVRKHKDSLTPERVRQLEELGFILQSRNVRSENQIKDRWENHIKALLDFKNAHGHFDVPSSSYKENSSLTRWVACIRSNAAWKLSPARIKKLDKKLGFQPGKDASTGIPSVIPGTASLAHQAKGTSKEKWGENMAALCDSQAKNGHDENWKRHIQQLLAFKKAHGHYEVSVNYKDNYDRAKWVRTVRGSKTT
jgi:hypothetical protein